MLKKLVATIGVLLVLIIASFAWWPSDSKVEEGTKAIGVPLTVARYYWPGTYWVEIADKKGWFKEAGLNIELIDSNPDYWKSLQDTVDGKIDVSNFTLFDLMRFNAGGADLVMVMNSDNSTGSEAIVVGPAIATLADLKGKSIGVDTGTYLEYILDVVLRRYGLMPSDVSKIKLAGEMAAEEFEKGKLDAIVTWEPVASEAIEKRNGRKLFDTSAIPGISPGGHTFRRSFIKERPADVQAYINVWHKTTQYIKDSPDEAFGIIAEIYNVTPAEAKAFARLARILDTRENLTSFSYGAGFESLHGTARQINKFLIAQGVTNEQLDSMEFIDATFIRALTHSLQQEAL
ncbi:ABC transporter substrate-binding protein [Photobacterium sp. SDRW27]|uniref:ABC transporter substrate-binding protein n=1 Tax=Photobacterium obscurum TaxID=2829490 RepID=UPI002244B837|nr:ABC transporter substrate-binding protein [Photobacterium obscurum]MCW8331377.1 ABC transporter substrate-binding protein [Photobacterium obscurum]